MPQTVKLALLDDYQKVALRMADWDRLRRRGVEITVFHEPLTSVEDAAAKLAPFDVLDGVVSLAAAREIYGVAVDAAGTIDLPATERLRLAEAAD